MAVFELRTYDIHPGRMADINARFRNHTMGLFQKHGIEVVDFWQRDDGDAGQLIYVCKFDDEAQMKRNWDAFRADPAWIAAKTKSEENGPLVKQVTSVTMRRTDYAPVK
jgi:hypothetical protein